MIRLSKPGAWRRRSIPVLLLVPAFGVLLIALLWWAVLSKLAKEERLILDAAMRASESMAAAVEQRALRAIRDADRTALLIKYLYERDGKVDLAWVTQKGLIPIDAYLLTSILDARGQVIASSERRAVGRDMSDRDYFQRHAAADSGMLDISRPTVLRITGKTSIQLTRRLNARDGTFAGIVLIGVDPDFFTQDARLGNLGVLGLIGTDGIYRARRAGIQPASTPDGSAIPFLAMVQVKPVGSYEGVSVIDHVNRLVAYRKLSEFPLIATAAQAKREVLADFEHDRLLHIGTTAAASVMIMVFFGVVTVLGWRLKQSHKRAWERANELRLASAVFETTADGIVVSDADDRILMVNAAFSKLTGFSPSEVVGFTVDDSPFRPIDPAESALRKEQWRRQGYLTAEVSRRRRDGTPLQLWLTATCVRDEAARIVNFVRVFSDISELKESQRQAEQLARCDALTGLPNRRVFHETLDKELLRAERLQSHIALLFLDLDRFKDVNDTLGHAAGDLVLKEVAERLKSSVREVDVVSRLGGDEFTIILADANFDDNAEALARRIDDGLAAPIAVAATQVRVSASIGIACYPEDGRDADELIKKADAMMYRAKNAAAALHDARDAQARAPDAAGAQAAAVADAPSS